MTVASRSGVNGAEKRTVAIMQPTFLPWAGYLAMAYASDIFVFLDDVPLNHRSWQTRNRIWSPQGPVWLTVPVKTKGRRNQLIRDTEVLLDDGAMNRLLGRLRHSYARANNFSTVYPALEEVLRKYLPLGLSTTNIELVKLFTSWLSIATEFRRSSEVPVPRSDKSTRLAQICEYLGATNYLAAQGSREYIEASNPQNWRNIHVDYFSYRHPEWKQLGNGAFEPYLSAIDLFMNDFDEAPRVVNSGLVLTGT